MAVVYSYIRFSSRKQAKGDSFKRQLEGEQWIKKNGHTKSDLEPLHDLGVSAFRGKNRHSGALRRFLDLIEEGKVAKGSILLVEHLDRLSREGVYDALPIWLQILNAGVKIAVLRPDEHVYSKNADPNDAMISLMLPLVYFYLAHLESHRKSDTLSKAWITKREAARNHQTPFNKRRPAWIDWDEENEDFSLNEEGAKAIRFIFDKTIEGLGQRYVLKQLQKHFAPIGLSKRWNSSYVQKILADRAVLGEFQPMKPNEEGVRVPDGPPIPNYYPAAIDDESIWYRAQHAKEERRKAKGPSASFVNIFAGLILNAHDGHKMHAQPFRRNKSGSLVVERRLVSYGHSRAIDGADPISIPYDEFENSVLWRLSELKPSDFTPRPVTTDLDSFHGAKKNIQNRIDELELLLSDPLSKQTATSLLSAMDRLREQKLQIECDLETAKSKNHAFIELADAQSIFDIVADTPAEQQSELRMKIRAKIAAMIDCIIVKPEKHYGRVWTAVQICFGEQYMCSHKHVFFGPGIMGEALPVLVDLESRRESNSVSIFSEIATEKAQPKQFEFNGDVPAKLGPAAEIWLEIARSNMAKQSFRVVPSKIERFVEVLGKELATKQISGNHWHQWTEWLKKEIEKENLKFSTARVAYSRAREFLNWLIEQGAVSHFPELKTSAARALS